MEELVAEFRVLLDLESLLTPEEIVAFERGTEIWAENYEPTKSDHKTTRYWVSVDAPSGKLTNVAVNVDSQAIMETRVLPDQDRQLQVSPPKLTKKELQLDFSLTATYIGADNDFDLFSTFDQEFQSQNSVWVRTLAVQDRAFIPLGPVTADFLNTEHEKQKNSKDGMGVPVLVAILMLAVGAVVLGVASAVYSVHSYRKAVYGQELRSPKQLDATLEIEEDKTSQPAKLNKPSVSFDESTIAKSVSHHSAKGPAVQTSLPKKPLSPNSLERGVMGPVDTDYSGYNEGSRFNRNDSRFEKSVGLGAMSTTSRDSSINGGSRFGNTSQADSAAYNTARLGNRSTYQTDAVPIRDEPSATNSHQTTNRSKSDPPSGASEVGDRSKRTEPLEPRQETTTEQSKRVRQAGKTPYLAMSEDKKRKMYRDNPISKNALFDDNVSNSLLQIVVSSSFTVLTVNTYFSSPQTILSEEPSTLDGRSFGVRSQHQSITSIKEYYGRNQDRPEPNDAAAHELMLTRSLGGTLGAAAVDGPPPPPSDFSSQANSFFARIIGRNQVTAATSNIAAPFRNNKTASRESSSTFASSKRAGLFDVFAPAGYIGIIVDTTKHGPAVHSLKPTSPMLGLINPGDLIVGLDDQDTRSMTAATLTKLMAKKANQKERKITLLAAADY